MRAVIFDVDGTLVDSVDAHARAWDETFRHFGHEFPYAELRHNVGKGADQYLEAFLPREEAERRHDEFVEYRLGIFQERHLPSVKGFPCVRELFERIRQDGKKIVLATSAKQDELHSYLELIRAEDLLDGTTTADDAARSKPHPDIFEAALDKLGLAPADAVVVGDTPYDAQAATHAGVQCVGVLCGGFEEKELRESGCSEIFRDPEDLLRRYDESLLSR